MARAATCARMVVRLAVKMAWVWREVRMKARRSGKEEQDSRMRTVSSTGRVERKEGVAIVAVWAW